MSSWLDTLLKVGKTVLPYVKPVAETVLAANAAKSAGKAQKAASSAVDSTLNERLALARASDARAQFLLDRYSSTYAPVEDALVQAAMQPISAEVDAGRAAADAERQNALARASFARNLGRRGIAPSDGAAVDAERQLALGAALNKATASTMARRAARTEQFNRLASVARGGAGLPGMAAGFSGMAGSGLSSVLASRDAALRDANLVDGQAGSVLGESLSGALQTLIDQIGKKQGSSSLPRTYIT